MRPRFLSFFAAALGAPNLFAGPPARAQASAAHPDSR